jgi:hypothetical protein
MVPKQPALNASMAEQLFQIVLGMIDRFFRTGDTKVFAAVTLLNASRLMFVPDYAQRPSTYAVLGMLHWIRYQRLTNSRADFDAAYRFFTHLYTIDPSVLPDGLREQFVEERPAPESIWEIQHTAGRVLVEEFYRDSGGLLLDNAIILYRMSRDGRTSAQRGHLVGAPRRAVQPYRTDRRMRLYLTPFRSSARWTARAVVDPAVIVASVNDTVLSPSGARA